MTADQLRYLFDKGELGPASTKNPSQLQRTAWFYITFFFGKRGRENQRNLKKSMLVLRKTTDGREYFEIDKKNPGAVLPTKNHQGGLQDDEDESDGKRFASPDSPRCPVATLQAYLSHLNPLNESLFQRPRPGSNKFNPANERIWFSNSPVGESIPWEVS